MILLLAILGCSVKGTVELVKAERIYDLAQEQNLRDQDMFSWTMANSYLKKAREEYANSHYEQAAILAQRSSEWLVKINPQLATEAAETSNSEEPNPTTQDSKSAENPSETTTNPEEK